MGCALATPLVALWSVSAFYWGGVVGALFGSFGVVYPYDFGWYIPMICSGQEDCVPLPLQIAKEAFAEVSTTGL